MTSAATALLEETGLIDDQVLIRAAQQGDRHAFGELVRRHRDGLVRVVYRIGINVALDALRREKPAGDPDALDERGKLVRMVNNYEETGEKVSVRQGFRLGWSRASWRLFLADLLFGLGGFIVVILLLALAAAPLLLWLTQNETAEIIGTVIAITLGVLVIFALFLVAIALSVLGQFFHRAIILENLGVFEGIRRGWQVARRGLGDSAIMGLILFGLSLASVIVLIPIILLLVVTGVIAGGLPALLGGAITNIFIHGNVPQMVAIAIGLPIFLLVMIIPLAFLGGLVETYFSSVWTLTYREIVALERLGGPTAIPPSSDAPLTAPAG